MPMLWCVLCVCTFVSTEHKQGHSQTPEIMDSHKLVATLETLQQLQKLIFEPQHDKTNKMTVRPVRLRSAWASAQSDQSLHCPYEEDSDQPGHLPSLIRESSLCAQWVAKALRFLHANSEDSDQTGRMPRLI